MTNGERMRERMRERERERERERVRGIRADMTMVMMIKLDRQEGF